MDETDPGPGAPNGQTQVTRVLIVEDERLLGELLADIIADQPDLAVAGVAGSVTEVRAFRGRGPHVVLMDYRLPDGTGAEATRIARSRWPTTRVVMLSALYDDETVLESIQAGADGFLGKDRPSNEIVTAIRRARAGELLLPPGLIVEIARRVAAGRLESTQTAKFEPLTSRERDVLKALAEGMSTRAITEEYSLSPNTLRTHVQHILSKLGAHSKLEAVTIALRLGLVTPPSEVRSVARGVTGSPPLA